MKKLFSTLWPTAICLLTAGCSTTNNDLESSEPLGFYDNAAGLENLTPPSSGDKFEDFTDNPFVEAAKEPTSTFSTDADGASYAIMRRYLNSGYNVPPQSVRIEEFLNYFTYDYDAPTDGQALAINAEISICPWNREHQLLRLGLKGRELTDVEMPRANFVFLVDVSGSMAGSERLDLLKSGLLELLYQLRPDDRISLITYSGEVKKLLESTPVREADKIRTAISHLNAGGCTAGGEALKMAYEEALSNYDAKANNRVIMGTDGDFNVGVTSTNELVEMVEGYASKGIYMTCLGFGMGNLNDAMMEQISNKGNGTYHYIDSENEMMKVLVHERERFVSVANDVKCQVTFNPNIVGKYRLIGYENRLMNNEDFTDDKKDAGEIGAGQTVTALYEIELDKDWENLLKSGGYMSDIHYPMIVFDCRYKKSLGTESIPLKRVINYQEMLEKRENSASFYFAAGLAAYGMLLRQSPYKGDATYDMVKKLIGSDGFPIGSSPIDYNAELLQLIEKAEKQTERLQ